MEQSALAFKTYTFTAEYSAGHYWNVHFYIYKGDFGRFEAWDPKRHKNIPKELGSFPNSEYLISDVTLNGSSIYINGQLNEAVIEQNSSSGMSIKFNEPISSSSEILVTLKRATPYIPWIPYKDRGEFYYAPRKGMIDWDALPCDSLLLKQYINMEFGSIPNWNGVVPINYLGVMVNIANSLLEKNDELKGRGIVSIIKNNSNIGTALYNKDGELLSSSPTEVIKYKYEIRWGRMKLALGDILSTASPSIVTISECLTSQYVNLKYHTLDINPILTSINGIYNQLLNLKYYIIFPYLIYGDFGIKTEKLNHPYRFPKYNNSAAINDVDLKYRSSFFDLSNDEPKVPTMVDRLIWLSKLDANSIKLNAKISPPSYSNGILDEFNFLNSRIKINKLIKIKGVKLYEGPLSGIENYKFTGWNDNSLETTRKLEEDIQKVLSKDYSLNIGDTLDILNNIEVIVIAESNCSRNFDSFSEDDKYTINGKLIDSRWLMAVKNILNESNGEIDSDYDANIEYVMKENYPNDSILEYEKLWEFTGVSKKTIDIIYQYAKENIGKICVFLVVRGIDDNNLSEIIFKEKNQDYISRDPYDRFIYDIKKVEGVKDLNWNISNSDNIGIPVTSVSGNMGEDSNNKLEGLNYLTIYLKRNEDDDLLDKDIDFYEISRKVISNSKKTFNFNIFEDLLCPLRVLEDGKTFVFNPPEIGPLKEIKISNKVLQVTPYEFDLIFSSKDGDKPVGVSYDFQIVYEDNKILPFAPSPENMSVPDPTRLGWVAIVENGKLTGIKMSQPWDEETQFFLRCIKKPTSFKGRLNPIKKTSTIKIKAEAIGVEYYPSIEFYLNRNENNTTSLECSGINRLNTNRNHSWYLELIPGRGLKVRNNNDRGVSFDASESKLNPFQLTIDGDMLFPHVYFDPYQENQRTEEIEKKEANGFNNLPKGSELEFNTNLTNRGTLNVSTLSTYFSSIDTDIRIFSIYDKIFGKAYILSNADGVLKTVMANSNFRDKSDSLIIVDKDNMENMPYDNIFFNNKKEKIAFLGVSFLLNNLIVSSLVDSNPKTLKAFLFDKTIAEYKPPKSRWIIETVKTMVMDNFIEGIEIEANIPTGTKEVLSNSAFVTISYSSTQASSEEIDYGYTYGFLHKNIYGLETIKEPQIFTLKNGKNTISCPCLPEPQYIYINLVIPNNLTQSQFDMYKETISNIDIKVVGLYGVNGKRVPKPLSMSTCISGDGKIHLFFNSKYIYLLNGEEYKPISFEDASITQYITTKNEFNSWVSPSMYNKAVRMEEFEGYREEIEALTSSGYSLTQAEILAQPLRHPYIPLTINAMRSPSVILDSLGDSSYLFGLFRAGNYYSATCWKINNSSLTEYFSPSLINKYTFDEPLPRSSNDLLSSEKFSSRLIASGLSKQQLGVLKFDNGNLIVVYENALQDIKVKISKDNGLFWREIPINIFGEESNFNGCKNISLVYDSIRKSIYFFGLKPIGNEYHLYFISIEESLILRLSSLESGDKEVVEIQKELNQKSKVLVVGDPNDLIETDYTVKDVIDNPKTIIGNAIKKDDGNFIILKPYNSIEEILNWDEENPSHFSYSLDENIKTVHYVHGYVESNGNIRVFYLNNVLNTNTIACKVSQNCGQTWQVDLLV